MDAAIVAWQTSPHPTPAVLLGFCSGTWYAVASDASSIVTFVKSTPNGHGKVYAAVKSKCIVQAQGGHHVYVINETGALSVVSCTQPDKKDNKESVEGWVVKTIVSLFKGAI